MKIHTLNKSMTTAIIHYTPNFSYNYGQGLTCLLNKYKYRFTKKKKLDELKKFVMFPDFYDFFDKYDSGSEASLVKQVPLTKENIRIIDEIASKVPIIRRYRGPRSKNIHRECHKHMAERVSVYLR